MVGGCIEMNKLKFKDSRYTLQVGLNEIGTKKPD
jgi:hypothetical protein